MRAISILCKWGTGTARRTSDPNEDIFTHESSGVPFPSGPLASNFQTMFKPILSLPRFSLPQTATPAAQRRMIWGIAFSAESTTCNVPESSVAVQPTSEAVGTRAGRPTKESPLRQCSLLRQKSARGASSSSRLKFCAHEVSELFAWMRTPSLRRQGIAKLPILSDLTTVKKGFGSGMSREKCFHF